MTAPTSRVQPPAGGGFTLVEVIVALVLLVTVTLATLELIRRTHVRLGEAERLEVSLWAATAVADSLASGTLGGSGRRPLPGGFELRWRSGAPGAVQVVEPATGAAWIHLDAVVGPGPEPVPGSGVR